jgi:hypothetical protein
MGNVVDRLSLLLLSAVTVFACHPGGGRGAVEQVGFGVAERDNVASQTRPIVNGQPHGGHPAVGMLVSVYPKGVQFFCTATLVGCKTVLTAAHCIYAYDGDGKTIPCDASTQAAPDLVCGSDGYLRNTNIAFVADCNDLSNCSLGASKIYQADMIAVHPSYDPNAYYSTPDLAVVRLKQAPAVTPASITAQSPYSSMPLTLIGFGRTNDDTSGGDGAIKRIAQSYVSKTSGTHLAFPAGEGQYGSVCSGDSGGPAFATVGGIEVQVGVHSYVETEPIGDGSTYYCRDSFSARLDLSWIQQQAAGDLQMDSTGLNCGPAPTDQAGPQISNIAPQSGSTVAAKDGLASIVVSAQVTDASGVGAVALKLSGITTAVMSPVGNNLYQATLVLPVGSQNLTIEATDGVGNLQSAAVQVVVVEGSESPSSTDPHPSQISIIEPAGGALVGLQVQLRASVVDADGISKIYATVDGAIVQSLTPDASGVVQAQLSLKEGQRVIAVVVIDVHKNQMQQAVTVNAIAGGSSPRTGVPPGESIRPVLIGGCELGAGSALRNVGPALLLVLLLFGCRSRYRRVRVRAPRRRAQLR